MCAHTDYRCKNKEEFLRIEIDTNLIYKEGRTESTFIE